MRARDVPSLDPQRPLDEQRERDEDRPGERVPDRRVRERCDPSSRMYFVTLRLSAHRTTVVRSISSTEVGRRTFDATSLGQAARTRAREAARRRLAQPRFAAGLAGLGCGITRFESSSPSASCARRSAKRPMATTSGRAAPRRSLPSASSQTRKSGHAFSGRELVRCGSSRLVHEDERAPVRDEHPVEESLCRSEAIARPAPEARAAHLAFARTRSRRSAVAGARAEACRPAR